MKFYGRWIAGLATILLGVFLVGCKSSDNYNYDPLGGDNQQPAASAAPAAPAPAAQAAVETSPVSSPASAPVTASDTAPATGGNAVPMPNAPLAAPLLSVLHVGDTVTVNFQDVPTPIPAIDSIIKDDGTITILYNKTFQAAGKTVEQLEQDIRARYVPAYFVNLTPTVKLADRFFNVGGEVKAPGRQVYAGKMTVLGAVSAAGGFTDYARKNKVQLTRADGQKLIVNCSEALRHPEKDLEVYPNDTVWVPKRLW